jgi:CRP/FNR family transcriptional regulator, cyclic AMP receptor protein
MTVGPSTPTRFGTDQADRENSVLAGQHWQNLLGHQLKLRPKQALPHDSLGAYYLNSGLVKLVRFEPTTNKQITSLVGPGEVIDELALFDGVSIPSAAVAIFSSVLSFVSRTSFETYLSNKPQLQRRIMSVLVRRLRCTDTEMMLLYYVSPQVRLARVLLRIAEAATTQQISSDVLVVPIILTQTDLASMVGIAREVVSRTLSSWEQSKFMIRRTSYEYVFSLSRLCLLANNGKTQ